MTRYIKQDIESIISKISFSKKHNHPIVVTVNYHPHMWNDGRIYLHRLIHEDAIGKYLPPEMLFRYKDGDYNNIDIDNIKCITTMELRKEKSLNNKVKIIMSCGYCHKEFKAEKKHTQFCSPECMGKARQGKIGKTRVYHLTDWCSVEKMEKLVWKFTAIKIGKMFGVTDRAVGHFCKRNNIKKPDRGYWAKQRAKEQKELIDSD